MQCGVEGLGHVSYDHIRDRVQTLVSIVFQYILREGEVAGKS